MWPSQTANTVPTSIDPAYGQVLQPDLHLHASVAWNHSRRVTSRPFYSPMHGDLLLPVLYSSRCDRLLLACARPMAASLPGRQPERERPLLCWMMSDRVRTLGEQLARSYQGHLDLARG